MIEAAPATLEVATNADEVRARFLAERRTGIGGSDAAAAVGLSPYKTPYQLWLEKTGQVDDELPEEYANAERIEWGIRMEDVIARAYAERNGVKVARVNATLRHPEHPFLLAHLDRRVIGTKRGLEIKTVDKDAARFGEWGPSGTDQVPTTYHLQVQHYYLVGGFTEFHLAALVGGNELRVYPIPRDEDLIGTLRDLEIAFWRSVETQTPPEIISADDARRRYPKSEKKPIEASADMIGAIGELRRLQADEKRLKGEIDTVKGRICGFMGECDELTFRGDTLATWRTSERAGYVAKPTITRTFRLKGEK